MQRKVANPRLIDYFNLTFTQEDVDFVIPHLQEDTPLYLDPFLLWTSDNTEYQELHAKLLSFFDNVRILVNLGKISEATALLSRCSELNELGLGYSVGNKKGSSIGKQLIGDIIHAFQAIPQLSNNNITHIEELQLIVPKIAEDRISDITSAILKDFLLDFTAQRAKDLDIPTKRFMFDNIYDESRRLWKPKGQIELPYNPIDDSPLVFAPLNLLRHLPWINYEDYYRSGFAPYVLAPDRSNKRVSKPQVLAYNRENFRNVERYVYEKELLADRCKPDPLFDRLSLPTLQKKFASLRTLETGKIDGADRKYEELVESLFSSLFYPSLEFAEGRVRTLSGAHIRDLIFYNDGKTEFWRDLIERYEARQPVFELKNVKSLDTEHVNQLHRYLDEEFGKFGVLVTRNPAPKAILKNTVDLHSSKRCVILCIDDSDIELMLNMLDAGRDPADVLKKKFVEFTRMLPK